MNLFLCAIFPSTREALRRTTYKQKNFNVLTVFLGIWNEQKNYVLYFSSKNLIFCNPDYG